MPKLMLANAFRVESNPSALHAALELVRRFNSAVVWPVRQLFPSDLDDPLVRLSPGEAAELELDVSGAPGTTIHLYPDVNVTDGHVRFDVSRPVSVTLDADGTGTATFVVTPRRADATGTCDLLVHSVNAAEPNTPPETTSFTGIRAAGDGMAFATLALVMICIGVAAQLVKTDWPLLGLLTLIALIPFFWSQPKYAKVRFEPSVLLRERRLWWVGAAIVLGLAGWYGINLARNDLPYPHVPICHQEGGGLACSAGDTLFSNTMSFAAAALLFGAVLIALAPAIRPRQVPGRLFLVAVAVPVMLYDFTLIPELLTKDRVKISIQEGTYSIPCADGQDRRIEIAGSNAVSINAACGSPQSEPIAPNDVLIVSDTRAVFVERRTSSEALSFSGDAALLESAIRASARERIALWADDVAPGAEDKVPDLVREIGPYRTLKATENLGNKFEIELSDANNAFDIAFADLRRVNLSGLPQDEITQLETVNTELNRTARAFAQLQSTLTNAQTNVDDGLRTLLRLGGDTSADAEALYGSIARQRAAISNILSRTDYALVELLPQLKNLRSFETALIQLERQADEVMERAKDLEQTIDNWGPQIPQGGSVTIPSGAELSNLINRTKTSGTSGSTADITTPARSRDTARAALEIFTETANRLRGTPAPDEIAIRHELRVADADGIPSVTYSQQIPGGAALPSELLGPSNAKLSADRIAGPNYANLSRLGRLVTASPLLYGLNRLYVRSYHLTGWTLAILPVLLLIWRMGGRVRWPIWVGGFALTLLPALAGMMLTSGLGERMDLQDASWMGLDVRSSWSGMTGPGLHTYAGPDIAARTLLGVPISHVLGATALALAFALVATFCRAVLIALPGRRLLRLGLFGFVIFSTGFIVLLAEAYVGLGNAENIELELFIAVVAIAVVGVIWSLAEVAFSRREPPPDATVIEDGPEPAT